MCLVYRGTDSWRNNIYTSFTVAMLQLTTMQFKYGIEKFLKKFILRKPDILVI